MSSDTETKDCLHSQDESFTGIASTYEKYRASYPAAAAEKILEGFLPPVRVADIGCGTGIASRVLAEHGAQVIGVEPNADMIAQAQNFATNSEAHLEFQIGSGEKTGLDDGSVEVVVCAQSYQWFRPEVALPELHRILRPGGRLVLMWNDKSDTDPFSVNFSRILKQAQAEAKRTGQWQKRNNSRDPSTSGLFDNVRKWSCPNPQPLDLEGVFGRARSASFFPTNEESRKPLEDQLRTLFDQHARDGQVVLHHDTELTIADRVG